MAQELVFLKEIKSLSKNIESNAEQAVNQLVKCLSDHPAFIMDNEPTINLLNSVAAVLESGLAQTEIGCLKEALWHYWLNIFHHQKLDIFFFGNEEHAGYFYQYLDKSALGNFYFIKCTLTEPVSAAAFHQQLTESQRPIIIYDHDAANILTLPEVNAALLIADFQEVMFNKAAPFSYNEDTFIAYLQEKHLRLINKDPATLIVGNSYCYHAFPQKNLRSAVNLAMHSMDMKQAQAMIAHYTERGNVKEIVIMFGMFDLFYELAKTRAEENIRVVNILSHYNQLNNIIPHHKTRQSFVDRTACEWAAEIIPFHMNVPALNNIHQKLDCAETLAKCHDFWEQRKEDAAFLDESEAPVSSAARAKLHSKNYKYKLSQQANMRLLLEIAEQTKKSGITVHYVIPPFPAAYREHMHQGMLQENRTFLDSLCGDGFVLHDLSAHQDFDRIDFLDGDHINYTGALKIIKVLENAGVAL
ncbi:hypothetical protein [Pantoea sp. FN0305]|uniref:hypothetical protein n=1 Tax=Pantoea sp. FN0305 TaxID=3418559 RepID=UPI003CFA0232